MLERFVPSSGADEGEDDAAIQFEWQVAAIATQLSIGKPIVTCNQLDTPDNYSLSLSGDISAEITTSGCTFRVRPISMPSTRWFPVDFEQPSWCTVGPVSLVGITSFFVFEVTDPSGTMSREFALNCQLVNPPENRRERLLREILSDPNRVLKFLLLLLGDGDPADVTGTGDGPGDSSKQGSNSNAHEQAALLELLLRTLSRSPSLLSQVATLIEDLESSDEGKQLLPAGLAEVWQPVRSVWQDFERKGQVMSQSIERPDVSEILAGLKNFQRRTVDYAFRRMYLDEDCNSRFLVADEVGLGKTLVARGLIAKTIDHLWDKRKRIDVVYVCSNAEIARQNLTKLNVCKNCGISQATRLTLLAITLRQLNKQRVNFISFTPNTSFELSRTGWSRERELLFYLITNEREGVNFNKATRLLEANANTEHFRQRVRLFPEEHPTPHPKIAHNFWHRLQKQPELLKEFDELCEQMPRLGAQVPTELRTRCNALIGTMRRILAEAGLDWLEPDLIILDEFQRFKELLQTSSEEDGSPAAELAQQIFSYRDDKDDPNSSARVLLLSATPYKMYTMHHERERDDHYADFQATLKFLFENDEANLAQTTRLIDRYRDLLLRINEGDTTQISEVKHGLEDQLRKVMARTERLAASQDRAGMLVEKQSMTPALSPSDVKAYVHLQQIATAVEQPDMVSYWKSAPYLLNFMDEYDIKRTVTKLCDDSEQSTEFVHAFRSALPTLLSSDDVENYSRIDAGNAQMRAFHNQMIERGLWKLLWIPASRPYYQPAGAFAEPESGQITKQLVFSCWKVVPKVVAALLSYEAERYMLRTFNRRAKNTVESRKKRRALLQFRTSRGEPTGMPAFALMYPCRYFAESIMPLALVAEADGAHVPSVADALRAAEATIAPELARITNGANSEIGDEDHDWYWRHPCFSICANIAMSFSTG